MKSRSSSIVDIIGKMTDFEQDMTAREFWRCFVKKLGLKGWKIVSRQKLVGSYVYMKFIDGLDNRYKLMYSTPEMLGLAIEISVAGSFRSCRSYREFEDDVICKILKKMKMLLETGLSISLMNDKIVRGEDEGRRILLNDYKTKIKSLEEFLINLDLNFGLDSCLKKNSL